MDLRRIEQLLRQYARRVPAERLFSERTAAELRARLANQVRQEARGGTGPEGSTSREVASIPARRARLWPLARTLTAAAAALIIFAVLTGDDKRGHPQLALRVDVAEDRAGLFRAAEERSQREGPPDQLYVGVRVDRPAYVRIIARDDRGRIEPLALDAAGSAELRVPDSRAFGAYALRAMDADGRATTLTHVMVLASARPMRPAALDRLVRRANERGGGTDETALGRFAQELRGKFNCTVRLLKP